MIQSADPLTRKEIPEWMSHYLINPPEWILLSLGVVAAIVFLCIFTGLYRSGLTEDTVKEMVTNLTYLVCCGGASWMVMGQISLSWPVAAALGWTLGSAAAWVLVPQFHLSVEDAFENADDLV